jgi:hypothetical protein
VADHIFALIKSIRANSRSNIDDDIRMISTFVVLLLNPMPYHNYEFASEKRDPLIDEVSSPTRASRNKQHYHSWIELKWRLTKTVTQSFA